MAEDGNGLVAENSSSARDYLKGKIQIYGISTKSHSTEKEEEAEKEGVNEMGLDSIFTLLTKRAKTKSLRLFAPQPSIYALP